MCWSALSGGAHTDTMQMQSGERRVSDRLRGNAHPASARSRRPAPLQWAVRESAASARRCAALQRATAAMTSPRAGSARPHRCRAPGVPPAAPLQPVRGELMLPQPEPARHDGKETPHCSETNFTA